MKHSLAILILANTISCTEDTTTSFRGDIYEQSVDLDDADASGLFAACPSADLGAYTLRWLDQPQADTTVVRFEFSMNLSGEEGFAHAACLQDYLKARGLMTIVGETEIGQYGTWIWGSTTEISPNDPSTTGAPGSTT